MTKQAIEVEGLPEGCEAVAVQFEPNYFNKYTGDDGYIYFEAKVKVKKIQPRRIALEETSEPSTEPQQVFWIDNECVTISSKNKWREVKETYITLTNSESKLSLSVDECKGLFEGNQPAINKVKEFIKENS